uniref:U6 snRNA-associated Sm-like protein LSm4 n=1 Tax=Peromyscus maniculatus bairdii TaxID=230844 RepID=A0A8C8UGK8_PERMB
MTLPLSLLKTEQNHPMLVELKNSEIYNGHLVSCDNWMNIREVICMSRDSNNSELKPYPSSCGAPTSPKKSYFLCLSLI